MHHRAYVIPVLVSFAFPLCLGAAPAATQPATAHNNPERVAWFGDLSLGMFIHWSVDAQLGVVISHSLVGASDDYCRRFFEELPKGFNPKRFDADEYASLAQLAGMRYVVFTTKHHSGFCMWDTKTTDFSIAHTPFGRDVTAELVTALAGAGSRSGSTSRRTTSTSCGSRGSRSAATRPTACCRSRTRRWRRSTGRSSRNC